MKKGLARSNSGGFTFLELMLVIAILGILATLITGNFLTSLKKGRDARRKIDIEQIQKSLEMYYEDKRAYPATITFGANLNDPISGKVYMQKIPNDPITNNNYVYTIDPDGVGNYYKLYSCLENTQDTGAGVNQAGYVDTDCGGCGICKYGISSGNVAL